MKPFKIVILWLFLVPVLSCKTGLEKQPVAPKFRVIAFHSAATEDAHMSFVHEANHWFAEKALEYGFTYDSTTDWNNLNADFLSDFQVVVFLDVRPDSAIQRAAFQKYMENGGAWMGFHFAGFALTPSAYPQDWDWYHNHFLGSGEYKGNTWKPTPAVLRVENRNHPVTRELPEILTASANEWYSWQNDLRTNPDIQILLSIDSTSFPLGTGPKLHEIWHSGYYPVVWTNRNYKMLYINMGHNDLDYASDTHKELSFTFGNEIQDKLILDGLFWLGRSSKK
jgi:hypothetical protein